MNTRLLQNYGVNNTRLLQNYGVNKEKNQTNNYYTVPVIVNSDLILKIYNINTIDELNKWIILKYDINYNNINILTVNRVLNSWIRNNYSILLLHDKILQQICNKLIIKYLKIIYKIDFEINLINAKDINYYINYWINKYNNKEFNLNLLDNLANYLIKKNF